MNHDLRLISEWAHDWRMSFNPDPQKQAVELLFSRKRNEIDHPMVLFNDTTVKRVTDHKHLEIILDFDQIQSSCAFLFTFFTKLLSYLMKFNVVVISIVIRD